MLDALSSSLFISFLMSIKTSCRIDDEKVSEQGTSGHDTINHCKYFTEKRIIEVACRNIRWNMPLNYSH